MSRPVALASNVRQNGRMSESLVKRDLNYGEQDEHGVDLSLIRYLLS